MPDPNDIPYVRAVKNAASADEIREIPIIGELYGTANAITDFVEYGCFPHWTVWVETLFPAAGKAVWQFLEFGWGDILRGYFRPTNIRGASAFARVPVRGKKVKTGKTGVINKIAKPPEIGNAIGKALPGSKFFQGRKVIGSERWIWIIDFHLQRALYYWLVADITEQFVVNWTTAIMESPECTEPGDGQFTAHKDILGPYAPDIWNGLIGWENDSDTTHGLWHAGTGRLTVPAGKAAKITLWGDSRSELFGTNDGCQVSAQVGDQSNPKTITSGWPVGTGDDPTKPAIAGTIIGPATVFCLMKIHGTGFQFPFDCHVSGVVYDDPGA